MLPWLAVIVPAVLVITGAAWRVGNRIGSLTAQVFALTLAVTADRAQQVSDDRRAHEEITDLRDTLSTHDRWHARRGDNWPIERQHRYDNPSTPE